MPDSSASVPAHPSLPGARAAASSFVDAVRAAPSPTSSCRRGKGRAPGAGARRGRRLSVLQDVRVTVIDGKYHPVDSARWPSSPRARRPSSTPSKRRGRQLLEPIVNLDVFCTRRAIRATSPAVWPASARASRHRSHAQRRNHHQGGTAGGSDRPPDRAEGYDRRPGPLRHRVQPPRRCAAGAEVSWWTRTSRASKKTESLAAGARLRPWRLRPSAGRSGCIAREAALVPFIAIVWEITPMSLAQLWLPVVVSALAVFLRLQPFQHAPPGSARP